MSYQNLGAYANTQNAHREVTESGRETDKRALLSCANRLREAVENGGQDMDMYRNAIRHNQKLWTMFQVGLSDPENALPNHLKVILLNLSRYIDRTSFRAITEFMPKLLESMMEINRTIAVGLAKEAPGTETQAQMQQPMGGVAPPPSAAGSVMTSA